MNREGIHQIVRLVPVWASELPLWDGIVAVGRIKWKRPVPLKDYRDIQLLTLKL